MKIVSVAQYTCEQAPCGKAITIYESEGGWLWLKALVDVEGFKTAFGSIDEIALSQGFVNMRLIHSKKYH
ncbi:hypothetical protein P7F88_03880 [Vibrio hannami]|uniref:hypothetical protein n=1 Tax=Vibrio hannami TaxID=2717094 RepID=UPI00240EC017|nr:hypothetical protein [Vibrio hannami]MDG3085287.1 hypothetical protein [Vibrio hannami]